MTYRKPSAKKAASMAMVFIVLIAGALAVGRVLNHEPSASIAATRITPSTPQCTHWAIVRCCQILGVPVDINAIVRLLPPRAAGHSLVEVKSTLERLGLEVSAEIVGPEDLHRGPFPCIAALEDPGHFVVVSAAVDDVVHVFDARGQRLIYSEPDFNRHWSGKTLFIRHPETKRTLAAGAGPCIAFDTLLLDRGDLPQSAEPYRFDFPFRNVGSSELSIVTEATACSCTTLEVPREPTPPNGQGVISIFVRPTQDGGPFSQEAIVRTNDPNVPLASLVAAGCTNSKVIVNPARVEFGEVPPGPKRQRFLFVQHRSESRDFEVRGTSSSDSAIRVRHFPLTPEWLREHEHGAIGEIRMLGTTVVVEVTFDPTAGHLPDSASIAIQTNIAGFENISVPVTGRVE